jgi:uncharacterized protein (TIGR02145 family)
MHRQLKFKSFNIKSLHLILFFILSWTTSLAQTDSITDIDGNVYRTVAIGTQWWMAENLKVSKYANGDEILLVKDKADWATADTGAYCYYANRSSNADLYGNLYNWSVAIDSRGVCPEGWHVPTDEEWITLEKHLGMSDSEARRMTAWRGTNEGDKLKSEGFGGNNSSGFGAQGTGYRHPDGTYKAAGTDNDYWTSTPYDNEGVTEGVLHGLLNTNPKVVRNFHVPGFGFCLRCVRDKAVQAADPIRQSDMGVYPNPATDQLFIRNAEGSNLTIMTVTGQRVLAERVQTALHYVDLAVLMCGTYVLSLSGGPDPLTSRIIVW